MYPPKPLAAWPAVLIDGVLAQLLAEPAREALRDERGPVTRNELFRQSGRLAFAFLKNGLRSGDRLLLGLPPDRRFVITLLAALRLGLVVVPIHPKAKLRELQHFLWDAAPRAACCGEALSDLLRTASAAVRTLDPDALVASLATLPQDERDDDETIELTHDHAGITASAADRALILYTSGTTGKPKGAVHTHGTLAANLAALAQAWQLSSSDRLVHCLPLHHLHGLVVGLLGSLYAGVALELVASFDEEAIVERIASSQATLFFGVPAMYARLVQTTPRGPLQSMRLFVSGSAPLAPALKRQFERRFGHVILERYGATETGIVLSQEVEGARPAGSVGRSLPGVETKIEIVDDGAMPADAKSSRDGGLEEGELLVRGPSLFHGYHEDTEATAKVMSDGWYRTGDLVRRNGDGSFAILGRLSTDMIKVKGHRVGALEIEAALAEHPGVAEVAVVGAPDEECGQVPLAFVRRRDDSLTAELLLAHAAAALAPHQVPRRVEFVDDFPRAGPGKIDRKELQARAARP